MPCSAARPSVAIVIPPGFGDASGKAFFGNGEKPALGVLFDPRTPSKWRWCAASSRSTSWRR